MLIQPLNRFHSTRLTVMKDNGSAQIVVGVDVGGSKKGFHTVALHDGHWSRMTFLTLSDNI